MESESKDPTKVEIIKQIKRLNDDGSYTFGYEAEDGTFKIESRDVLGNVKGTFGFVDSDGEIKRVSYTSSNSTESATVSSTEKSRSSVIQQIPKTNNRTISSTTRRPNIIYPSPSSTVIQTIPRRRISSSSSTSSSKDINTGSSSTTQSSHADRPSYKNVVKANDFDITTTARSSTESPIRTSTGQSRPTGHYIRSTIAPIAEAQRYTEGQLIRPTNPETITPRPTESYPRRVLISRNHYLDEAGSSSKIKPIVEDTYEDPMRSNLLRRQLHQEKITNFDPRQHVLNLQQSVGDDSTDVYSASLTTGPPRPLFTTTDRSRIYPTPTIPTLKGITPAKYQSFYQKNLVRNPRPTPYNYVQETTTTDATNTDNNYATPSPVPIVQIPQNEESLVRRHPFHRGAVLIPVNQLQGGRYVLEEPHEDVSQQQYVAQYAIPVPVDQQYLRETSNQAPIPYQYISQKRRPIPVVALDDYQNQQDVNLFTPRYQPPIPLNSNDLQEDIDHIKPPVSTKDFQKLLNRLIMRQSQLQEISRLEQRMVQPNYANPIYRSVQPTPVSIFVRNRPELRHTNGPVQFIPAPQTPRPKLFISMSQHQNHQMQKIMESQQQYNAVDPYNYQPSPMYRSGRRVARLLHPNTRTKEEDDNYLPPDVREMLLLRMLQLAINPNLPLPPSEGETMASQIRETKKQQIRNVEILGEERDDEKPVSRSKRYRESDEYYDY